MCEEKKWSSDGMKRSLLFCIRCGSLASVPSKGFPSISLF